MDIEENSDSEVNLSQSTIYPSQYYHLFQTPAGSHGENIKFYNFLKEVREIFKNGRCLVDFYKLKELFYEESHWKLLIDNKDKKVFLQHLPEIKCLIESFDCNERSIKFILKVLDCLKERSNNQTSKHIRPPLGNHYLIKRKTKESTFIEEIKQYSLIDKIFKEYKSKINPKNKDLTSVINKLFEIDSTIFEDNFNTVIDQLIFELTGILDFKKLFIIKDNENIKFSVIFMSGYFGSDEKEIKIHNFFNKMLRKGHFYLAEQAFIWKPHLLLILSANPVFGIEYYYGLNRDLNAIDFSSTATKIINSLIDRIGNVDSISCLSTGLLNIFSKQKIFLDQKELTKLAGAKGTRAFGMFHDLFFEDNKRYLSLRKLVENIINIMLFKKHLKPKEVIKEFYVPLVTTIRRYNPIRNDNENILIITMRHVINYLIYRTVLSIVFQSIIYFEEKDSLKNNEFIDNYNSFEEFLIFCNQYSSIREKFNSNRMTKSRIFDGYITNIVRETQLSFEDLIFGRFNFQDQTFTPRFDIPETLNIFSVKVESID